MNNMCKFLAVYAAVSCISGERIQAIDTGNVRCVVEVATKVGVLAALIWGVKKLSDLTAILADMRDMQFEQLMNNVCGNNLSSDNIQVSYEQEASEQISQTTDSLERNTSVATNIYVQLPANRSDYPECAETVEDDDNDNDEEDEDEEQCDGFDDCCE